MFMLLSAIIYPLNLKGNPSYIFRFFKISISSKCLQNKLNSLNNNKNASLNSSSSLKVGVLLLMNLIHKKKCFSLYIIILLYR